LNNSYWNKQECLNKKQQISYLERRVRLWNNLRQLCSCSIIVLTIVTKINKAQNKKLTGGGMVFNATFNNCSFISWQSVLSVGGVNRSNRWKPPTYCQSTDKLHHIMFDHFTKSNQDVLMFEQVIWKTKSTYNFTVVLDFLTLQDKHNIQTLSLNIKWIYTCCKTG
jgi:hypothetical protein